MQHQKRAIEARDIIMQGFALHAIDKALADGDGPTAKVNFGAALFFDLVEGRLDGYGEWFLEV
jgi:hypothetical protein